MANEFNRPEQPEDRRCWTCRHFHWVPHMMDSDGSQGYCRRNPPVISEGAEWPMIYAEDWCGEWSRLEGFEP